MFCNGYRVRETESVMCLTIMITYRIKYIFIHLMYKWYLFVFDMLVRYLIAICGRSSQKGPDGKIISFEVAFEVWSC